MTDPRDELVDVLDGTGAVVEVRTRREVREGNLLHRSVFIAVIDSADRIVVHQRAPWKDVWPSRWDLCFGGVVDSGESVADAAVRELAEEAGVVLDVGALEHLGDERYADDLVREFGTVYLARSDGPFTFPDGEVAASDRVPLTLLDAWVRERTMVPDSLAIVLPLLPLEGIRS